MRIGEVAALVGVSVDTVRHYERCGLLKKAPRTTAGYRMYSIDTVVRIRIIRSALAVGFTIAELSGIFKSRNAGGAPCREVRSMAGLKLKHLEDHIQDMQSLRGDLQRIIDRWNEMLRTTSHGQQARLLETLISQKPKGDQE